jgi:hypothetical protein
MTDTTMEEYAQGRCRELEAQAAQETQNAAVKFREAEQHKAKAAEISIRLDELASVLKSGKRQTLPKNVIPMHQPRRLERQKPSLRYRHPGVTTDIVTLLYTAPGTEIESVITRIYDAYKDQGTTRDTLGKMIRRLIREGYAYRDGIKLHLTEKCKAAWEARANASLPAKELFAAA